MKSKVLYYSVVTLTVLFTIGCAGLAMVLHGQTLVDWQLTLGCGMLSAAGLTALLFRHLAWLTRTANRWVNGIAGMVMFTSAIMAAFYALNYYGADDTTIHTERVMIDGKFRREHYRSRRVGRHTMARGERYYTYHINVMFADGRRKEIALSTGEYARVRTGDSIDYTMEQGLFGIPVIKNRRPPVPDYRRYRGH